MLSVAVKISESEGKGRLHQTVRGANGLHCRDSILYYLLLNVSQRMFQHRLAGNLQLWQLQQCLQQNL